MKDLVSAARLAVAEAGKALETLTAETEKLAARKCDIEARLYMIGRVAHCRDAVAAALAEYDAGAFNVADMECTLSLAVGELDDAMENANGGKL